MEHVKTTKEYQKSFPKDTYSPLKRDDVAGRQGAAKDVKGKG